MTPICNLLSLPPSSSLPFLLPPPLSYLPLIQGTLVDGAFAWSSPLIDSLVRPDVTNTIGIHLHTHTHTSTPSSSLFVMRAHSQRTWMRALSPRREHARVGVVPRNPESVTSSTVSPMERTRVALVNETTMYASYSSGGG